MNHPLCRKTVTLYRKSGLRLVIDDCFYSFQDCLTEDEEGRRFDRKCLLITDAEPRPGDRVMEGVGPENIDWKSFIPVNVPTLSEIAYASPKYIGGILHHYEAGRK